ncbi:unnamed protein product [Symbiodinium sp. CCMP2592]|nr:unnamed protein product [Symbiodinium sp. CCMP2592]
MQAAARDSDSSRSPSGEPRATPAPDAKKRSHDNSSSSSSSSSESKKRKDKVPRTLYSDSKLKICSLRMPRLAAVGSSNFPLQAMRSGGMDSTAQPLASLERWIRYTQVELIAVRSDLMQQRVEEASGLREQPPLPTAFRRSRLNPAGNAKERPRGGAPGRFHVDALAYNVGLKTVLETDDWARVLTTFDHMVERGATPIALDSSCSTAMVAAQKGLGWTQVVEFFSGIRRGAIDPGTAGYNTLISACVRAGEWEKAVSLFGAMERLRVQPDIFTFSSLITGLKAAARPEEAAHLFVTLRGRRLHADSVLVNTAISAASTGEAAVNLLHDMLDQEMEPDLFTYSSVLDALAADARWADAVDVVQDLQIRGFSPNNAVASTLLPIAPWTAALQMWLEAQHGMEPDQVLCGAHLASMEQGYYWQQAQLQEPLQPGAGRWGLSVTPVIYWAVPKLRHRCGLCRQASKRHAELLVDADQCGLHPTKEAIAQLRKEGFNVRTTVYAAPGRRNSKQWRKLFQHKGISLSPIPRSEDGEANDTAIETKLLQLAQSKGYICIALLTSDNDYVEQVREIASLPKKDMWVFVPVGGAASLATVLGNYNETNAHVVPVATSAIQAEQQRLGHGTKVRAILEADGHGSVKMAEHGLSPPPEHEGLNQLREFLQNLDYRDERREREHLLQSVAKFWFINRLGPLAVYPTHAAFVAACEVLRASSGKTSWTRYHNDHAFFLPITNNVSRTDKTLRDYGGRKPKRVFKGGGPFMMKDSPGMVAQVLRTMGYLDEAFNSDLPEALLLFVNRSEHKSTLRKILDLLPVSSDTAIDVEYKLRHAFLSNLTSGKWVVAQRDTHVRKTLRRHGFLQTIQAPQTDVMEAMKRFVRSRGLREMRSYNGYVSSIQQHMYHKDPDRVGNIEFQI